MLVEMLGARRPSGRYLNVSPDWVSRAVRQHMLNSGIDSSIHKLRHTFITELMRITKGNLSAVMPIVGHEQADTTLGYSGWDGGEMWGDVAAMYQQRAA